jgi:tryptophanyl-tRNA synthetase
MRIFSGIQPTGRKHLGNYIGAIRQYVEGQDRGEAIYCVVDMHAISVDYDPRALREYTLDTAAMLLSGVTAYGDLTRMTQFKDKAAKQGGLVSAALFFYPVLQAADVLVYRAHEVPVGDDQRQHLELMRDVAQRFNERFGETLVVPEHRIPTVGARIMDLQDPTSKMSTTSESETGRIHVLDEPKVVSKKIKSAVTDSGSEVRRAPDKPGVSNLIEILSVVQERSPESIEQEFDGQGYGAFKGAVADAVVDYLTPVRERYHELRQDEGELLRILGEGADRARVIASETVRDVRDRMGVGTQG